jgi:hypothetical protein
MGDLNSRVGNLNEYTPPFVFLAVRPNHKNEVVHEDHDFAPAPLRSRKDVIVSRSGKKCINFCKHLGCIILNGRCKGDLEGAKTFKAHGKGSSTVDLAVSSPDL